MLPIALIYGGFAGLVIIGASTLIFITGTDRTGVGSVWLGYLVMILAFTLIFVGVKRYRDRDKGGAIRFLPALAMGLAIALVASVIYVVVWEIYLAATNSVFITDYVAAVLADLRATGATPEQIAAKQAELDGVIAAYGNPLFRYAITFSEIFPVGFVVALISALVLRNPGILPARPSLEQGAA